MPCAPSALRSLAPSSSSTACAPAPPNTSGNRFGPSAAHSRDMPALVTTNCGGLGDVARPQHRQQLGWIRRRRHHDEPELREAAGVEAARDGTVISPSVMLSPNARNEVLAAAAAAPRRRCTPQLAVAPWPSVAVQVTRVVPIGKVDARRRARRRERRHPAGGGRLAAPASAPARRWSTGPACWPDTSAPAAGWSGASAWSACRRRTTTVTQRHGQGPTPSAAEAAPDPGGRLSRATRGRSYPASRPRGGSQVSAPRIRSSRA